MDTSTDTTALGRGSGTAVTRRDIFVAYGLRFAGKRQYILQKPAEIVTKKKLVTSASLRGDNPVKLTG